VRLASQVGEACQFIGATEASIWANKGDNQLKNQATKMGGNWVVVTGYKWEGAFLGNRPSSGDVYKCPEMAGSARVVDQTIDLNINSTRPNSTSPKENEVFGNLKKLKQLKDEGIITEDEYKTKKAELLDKL